MTTSVFPKMFRLRQNYPPSPSLDVRAAVLAGFEKIQIKPGARIAVAVGSRGITNLSSIVAATIEALKAAGAKPFIIPAMGSHGGATPEGQLGLLAGYGVSERKMGVPVRASLAVKKIGTTADGVDVFASVEALKADGIVVVNRIKPHTDFRGVIGSGLLKMLVIGIGKHKGAATCHIAATRLGLKHVVRTVARVVLRKVPILCG